MKQILILLLLVFFAGCSSSENANFEKIEDAAQRDAAKVVESAEGSMQREHAVLAIRVREEALRQAGYDYEADVYIGTAGKILIDSLHIIDNNQ